MLDSLTVTLAQKGHSLPFRSLLKAACNVAKSLVQGILLPEAKDKVAFSLLAPHAKANRAWQPNIATILPSEACFLQHTWVVSLVWWRVTGWVAKHTTCRGILKWWGLRRCRPLTSAAWGKCLLLGRQAWYLRENSDDWNIQETISPLKDHGFLENRTSFIYSILLRCVRWRWWLDMDRCTLFCCCFTPPLSCFWPQVGILSPKSSEISPQRKLNAMGGWEESCVTGINQCCLGTAKIIVSSSW